MAWDTTKSSGDLIKSADWNDMATVVNNNGMELVGQQAIAYTAPIFHRVSWTGLSGDYRYFIKVQAQATGNTNGALYLNGDTTSSHYYNERFYCDDVTIGSGRFNQPYVFSSWGAGGLYAECELAVDGAGYAAFVCRMNSPNTAAMVLNYYAGGKTNATMAEITDIKIEWILAGANSVTGIATLYRLKGG